jgi:hypothetical protein
MELMNVVEKIIETKRVDIGKEELDLVSSDKSSTLMENVFILECAKNGYMITKDEFDRYVRMLIKISHLGGGVLGTSAMVEQEMWRTVASEFGELPNTDLSVLTKSQQMAWALTMLASKNSVFFEPVVRILRRMIRRVRV